MDRRQMRDSALSGLIWGQYNANKNIYKKEIIIVIIIQRCCDPWHVQNPNEFRN